VAKSCPVELKIGKDRDEFVSIRHCIELGGFEVRCEFNCGIGIDINQHELIDEVFAKICKVGEGRYNFCKVSDCNRTFNAQAVGFNEDSFLFEP